MTKFLQDEVRSGFYIPTAIKQAWAVQLNILSEIDRICDKYNIKYFADWGTYLGTVRHGGFIPWDDDLDICMLREDYERFRKAAKTELADGYTFQDFETKENHWLFLARVVNANSICFDKEHLDKNYNFPYMATVDIFVLDYMYADESKELARCDEVKHIIALADGIVAGKYTKTSILGLLGNLEDRYGLKRGSLSAGVKSLPGKEENCDAEIRRQTGIALYHLAEKQMGRTPKEESIYIGQMFPWILTGGRGLPKEYYEEAVRLPFEFTTIPVPAYYHKGLAGRYGDYMKIHKIWGGHDYPYFEGQRANLQAVADFKLPEFTFKQEMLRENQPPIDRSVSLKSMAEECLSELAAMVDEVTRTPYMTNLETVLGKLAACQQLAVDLGTLVEEVKGENRESTAAVVGSLETFCETVYGLYMYLQDLDDGQISQDEAAGRKLQELVESFKTVEENVCKFIIKRKEVLFVSTGDSRWSGFRDLYKLAVSEGDVDVYVVEVPVRCKDVYGNIVLEDSENSTLKAGNLYEDAGMLEDFITDWKTYSLELHMPDVIFIQDEYDGENPCLTVPGKYYAENLQRYTDKLIYVPPFKVNEFKREDTTDWYNMKHYVTAPGVVRADVILVQSDNMRENYVERLTDFAGEDTREIWERKVVAEPAVIRECNVELKLEAVRIADAGQQDGAHNDDKGKCLMYCIGLNEIYEHSSDIIEKLKDRLDIMAGSTDKLDVVICTYPPDESVWKRGASGLPGDVLDMLREYSERTGVRFITGQQTVKEMLDDCDAYYGSPTPYAHYFNTVAKPVMVCDYSI